MISFTQLEDDVLSAQLRLINLTFICTDIRDMGARLTPILADIVKFQNDFSAAKDILVMSEAEVLINIYKGIKDTLVEILNRKE